MPARILKALLLTITATAAAQTPFCDQLRALTIAPDADPTVASAHWGIHVTSLTGTPVCAINEAQLFRPASNNKIFTTAAALALLGPSHTATTRLEAEGSIAKSTLRGNLLLIGAGDPSFGSRNIPYVPPSARPNPPIPESPTIPDIETFADAVFARGIRAITGDIVGDDTYFPWEPYPPSWNLDDIVYGYGAPVSALTIHDNAIDFTITPQPGNAKPLISFLPGVPYYQLDASVYSIPLTNNCDADIAYQRAVGSKTLRIYGNITPPAPSAPAYPCHQAIAIQDPAEYAALALKLALERRGIHVTGSAVARHFQPGQLGSVLHQRPDNDGFLQALMAKNQPVHVSCEAQAAAPLPGSPAPLPRTLLATHVSPPLLAEILYTNKVSQNQHAEVLLRDLSPEVDCGGYQSAGLHIVREYLLHAGVSPRDFVLYDGSGLSDHDLVAPRALTKFLAFAAAQPWFPQWKLTLPEGGANGTLGTRFKSFAPGALFAKTGTLGESRALSGYLVTATGQTLIFSVMVDTHLPGGATPTPAPDRATLDRIVELIATQN